MRVHHSRNDCLPASIDDTCRGAGEKARFPVGADKDNPPIPDRKCARTRMRPVDGVHISIDQNEIRFRGLSPRVTTERNGCGCDNSSAESEETRYRLNLHASFCATAAMFSR